MKQLQKCKKLSKYYILVIGGKKQYYIYKTKTEAEAIECLFHELGLETDGDYLEFIIIKDPFIDAHMYSRKVK